MDDFTRIINPIKRKFGKTYGNVFVKIEYKNEKLSITGVEAPLSSGNCRGSCGQIDMEYRGQGKTTHPKIVFNKGWNKEKWNKLLYVWDRYHLNDMRAGTPRQEELLRKHFGEKRVDYDETVEFLKSKRAYIDNGYEYGSKWLTEKVPEEVLNWLRSLQNTTTPYAWV